MTKNLIILYLCILYYCGGLELCDPYTAAYPCTACQYFAQLSSGYCICKDGYYMNTDLANQYCDICHTSCKTCYGSLETNCNTCSDGFTFVSEDSSCTPPDTDQDETVVQAYSFLGFSKLSGWTVTSFNANTYQCGYTTLLGGITSTSSRNIYVDISSLPNHYQLRVKANYYFLNANGTAKSAQIVIGSQSSNVVASLSSYSFHSCNSLSYIYLSVDQSLAHTGATARVQFKTNVHVHYGIRDVFVIVKKCHPDCITCTGYLSTQCLTCTDTRRQAISGVCTCKDNYYQQPYAGQCVDPCPSIPTKLYGDNQTRTCVEECPDGPPNRFAYDDLYRCWLDCPTVSVRNGLKLFRDYTNKKCVTNCPATQPYADQPTRTCYGTLLCPGTKKSVDTTNKRCVDTCPHKINDPTTSYLLFAHLKQCIPYCPSGYWGNPAKALCQATCDTSTSYKYMDNSTGENLCVTACPAPNRFKNPDTFYCVETCPDPYFGDDDQVCKTKCDSPLWGMYNYNRKCVALCPTGTWAQQTNRVCVNTTQGCNPKYANSFTRTCVIPTQCQFGTYADPTTYNCVSYCPSGRFGNPTTRICELSCVSPYFADSGNNLCVTVCATANTFASTTPTRACVTQCNTTGTTTPWADDSTRTCVSDCNNTVVDYVSLNTTWKCVYECPSPLVADRTTTVPKCVTVCPTNFYADFTSGTGKCVATCPSNPVMFGDANSGLNLCVQVCTLGTYGQATGNRLCRKTCPAPYFSQNDDLRRCVLVCNSTTFGYQQACAYHATDCEYSYKRLCYENPLSCPGDYFADSSTNLCVDPCPATQATFGNPLTKMCVRQCPDNPNAALGQPDTYFADSSIRQCVLTCNASHTTPLFGNNNTRTCVPVCLDYQSYAQVQTTYRLCVDKCLDSPVRHYANKFTKVCGTSINCPTGYFGQNTTQICVQECPTSQTNWAYINATQKLCVQLCPSPQYGDDSTGKLICVDTCPTLPDRYADIPDRICRDTCDGGFYGDPVNRECVNLCLDTYYALDTTGRCVQSCPEGYFGDSTPTVRKCWPTSAQCTSGFGDSYLRQCVPICTGPNPVNTFGSGDDCVPFCPPDTFADSHTPSRLCVPTCPGTVDSLAAPNLYGDPTTRRCVGTCITPLTWADPHTRQCQEECSTIPPLYSENFGMTCVASLNCPTSPTMTFGDNQTRSCVSFCSNSQFGDPTSRNCVDRCPDDTETLTETYYGDTSTGQYICVTVCPEVPRLFGENVTNLCVDECPGDSWGDQTGKRTCVDRCPNITGVHHYAQNFQKICVTVCKEDTWGLKSTQKCVEDPFDCGTLWADDSTHMCVDVCPLISGLFADPISHKCVEVCPPNSYASDLTRECVTGCPENNGVHDTFANNDTHICQQVCQSPDTYGDPQTGNRYCVSSCSQSPEQSFADPSTKTCVPECPTHPSLFGQTDNHKCVQACISPYYADTHTRRCQTNCPGAQFKLSSPRKCVSVCPSSPDLYGDSVSGMCQTTCTNGQFKYAVLRICVASCSTYSLFQYNGACVKFCPSGYYANSSSNCVTPCPSSKFGQNTTTTCQSTCITGFAHDSLCKAICPDNLYGENKVCVADCAVGIASDINNLCVSQCLVGTFSEGGDCVQTCVSGYADPDTHICESSCTSGRYADPNTMTCVQICPAGWYRDPSFVCKDDCDPLRSDNISLTCTTECSNGLWGYQHQCISQCPTTYYGYQDDRDCYQINSPPAVDLFADPQTKTWVSQCPQNPLTFGDRLLWKCVQTCSDSSYYRDPYSRQCQTACTNTSYYLDPTTFNCVLICPQGYNANPDTGTCQQNCTNNRYDYQPEHKCVQICPRPYYGLNLGTNLKTCVIECPPGRYAEGDLCQTGCTLPLYADDVTHRCVAECIDSFALDSTISCEATCTQDNKIADNSTNKCVSECPSDPDYYQENGVCVMHCQQANHYADPTAGVRQCTTLCTQGLFADPVSGRCLSSCLPGYYAHDDTNLCVTACPSNFADNQTRQCVPTCPAPTFADTLTNKCTRICSGTQYGQGRVCVPMCSQGLYGNPLTRECESGCPDFDYSFAQNNTNLCVKDCSTYTNQYADRNINVCVSNCTLANEYMLDVVGICTSLCPQGQFMESSTKRCQTGCTTGFAEPTTRYCVTDCPDTPQTFAHTDTKTCRYQCLSLGLYADNSTNYCVAHNACNRSLNYFSDPVSGYCVLFCPEGYYTQNATWTCTTYCVTGFADNFTRKCVLVCPQAQQTYGDHSTHTCVKVCPDQTYADEDLQECVAFADCPSNTWADILSKHCVTRCPSQPLFFGYNATRLCVDECPAADNLFGDYVTQTCVTACAAVGGQLQFADQLSRTCVFRCSISDDMYGDPNSGKCETTCTLGWLRDNSTQRCVSTCPSDPDYYALDGSCVRKCPDGKFASVQAGRLCIDDCGVHSTFGDTVINECVSFCQAPYFADESTDMCVLTCPSTPDIYADPTARTCQSVCPWGPDWRTFSQPIDRTCVTRCPPGYFAQNSSRTCLQQCPPDQYADPIIQVCVQDCTIRPKYYKQTNDRVCVQQCPDGTGSHVKAYKYEPNNTCLETSGSLSGCPGSYFANVLNDYCTQLCPYGYFAQDSTKFCVQECSASQYADQADRRCKTACTTSPNFYAYTSTPNLCVQYCPENTFSQNVTWTCVTGCPNTTASQVLYAYEPTRQCVFKCPAPYYSYLPDQECILECPDGHFAQDQTRSCDLGCTNQYFADPSTNRCVQICPQTPELYGHLNQCITGCPDGFYKDISTRECVTVCPIQPLLFADDSTNMCVEDCPSTPNYFADNQTQTCVDLCSEGTFAEVTSRTCMQSCPDDLNTYAYEYTDPGTGVISRICQAYCPDPFFSSDLTQECVTQCPNLPVKTYAYIDNTELINKRKCVFTCPTGFFGNNDTRVCETNCLTLANSWADTTTHLCVTTCPYGFFAYNATSQCRRTCPGGLYADNTTRSCVVNCPGTQRLFNDPTTFECVSQCPMGYYGDISEWKCITACSTTATGYILEISRLCVEQCPEPYFALVSQRLCVTNCGTGLFGDPVTRECKQCPSQCVTCLALDSCLTCQADLYLQYGRCITQCTITNTVANYANSILMKCLSAKKCQTGTYGNNATKSCVTSCPARMYGNSTKRTCQNCPSTCQVCSSMTSCSTCVDNAQFAQSDSFCYSHCNSTHRYMFEQSCHQTCPDGSYEDYTGVRCQACNQICLTCSESALNCTNCDNTFMLNNTCLTRCPADYYSNQTHCLQCTDTVQSCNNPLSFTTSTYVQNYKQVIVMKFNQKAVIDGDPKQFIKVRLTVKRRLIETVSDLVNNGLEYDAEIMPDGTIRLILADGISLEDVAYEIIVTDPSKIKTQSGATLQSLQAQLELEIAQQYDQSQLQTAPLVVAGTILAIIILIITFFNLLLGAFPIYLAIQAAQITSLFAYCNSLPPNLFYFLRQLRLTRFVFMPNIFTGIYIQPETYVDAIPQKVVDTEGQLSFAQNGTSFIFFVFFYIVLAFVIFMFTTRFNGNRPLKVLFMKIHETRTKYGILNDFIWLFAINILVQTGLQFYYMVNAADLAIGIVFGIATLALMIGLFIYGYRLRKAAENEEDRLVSDLDDYGGFSNNYYMLIQGTKNQKMPQSFYFVYYVRKILFVVLLSSTMFEPLIQASLLLALFCIMIIFMMVVRPYKQHFRNAVIIINQGFMGFLCGGIIYFLHMITNREPSGAKITCGLVLTIVAIVHLSLITIYCLYCTYNYIKHLKQQFQKTEFYRLYLDQDYDQSIEKQLGDIAADDNGEIQSVQITNVASNQYDYDRLNNEEDQSQQIIKLKIKRRVKKNKFKQIVHEESKVREQHKNRVKDTYVKVEQTDNYYKLNAKKKPEGEYQKLVIQESQPQNKNVPYKKVEAKKEDEWAQVKANQSGDQDKYKSPRENDDNYEEIKKGDNQINNIFEEIDAISDKEEENKANDNNNQQNQENLRPKTNRIQNDFNEENFFPPEQEQEKQNKQQEIQKQNNEADDVQEKQKSIPDEQKYDEFQMLSNGNDQENQQENLKKSNQRNKEKPQNNTKLRQSVYDMFDMDQDLPNNQNDAEKKPDQQLNQQKQQQQGQKQDEDNKEKLRNQNWQIEDLEEDQEKLEEDEKKQREKSKKMHLMLFDDDDFE